MLSCLQDNIEDWSKVTGNRYVAGTPLKFQVSDYIPNPVNKVLSVRIYFPAGT